MTEIIGYDTVGANNAPVGATSPALMVDIDYQVSEDSVFQSASFYGANLTGIDSNIEIGVYAANSLVGKVDITIPAGGSAGWYTANSSATINLLAGVNYRIVASAPTQNTSYYFTPLGGSAHYSATNSQTDLPATFVPSASATNRKISAYITAGVDGQTPPGISSINDGSGVRAGSTGNTLVTSAGFTPTSGTIDGIPVTNIAGESPNFTFDLPGFAEGDEHPFYGSKTAVFTDGTNSPELTVELLPKAGHAYQTISGTPDTSINGIGYQFDPVLTAGDQIEFPTPAVTVGATGGYPGTSATEGTHLCGHISSLDNIYRLFQLKAGN